MVPAFPAVALPSLRLRLCLEAATRRFDKRICRVAAFCRRAGRPAVFAAGRGRWRRAGRLRPGRADEGACGERAGPEAAARRRRDRHRGPGKASRSEPRAARRRGRCVPQPHGLGNASPARRDAPAAPRNRGAAGALPDEREHGSGGRTPDPRPRRLRAAAAGGPGEQPGTPAVHGRAGRPATLSESDEGSRRGSPSRRAASVGPRLATRWPRSWWPSVARGPHPRAVARAAASAAIWGVRSEGMIRSSGNGDRPCFSPRQAPHADDDQHSSDGGGRGGFARADPPGRRYAYESVDVRPPADGALESVPRLNAHAGR